MGMRWGRWSTIHGEASVQTPCVTWHFAYFDVAWVVHGYPRRGGSMPKHRHYGGEEGWKTIVRLAHRQLFVVMACLDPTLDLWSRNPLT